MVEQGSDSSLATLAAALLSAEPEPRDPREAIHQHFQILLVSSQIHGVLATKHW